MRYSRFNEALGLYEVFEDDRQHAINADHPQPQLPKAQTQIGVPAREAGRPLPGGAKRVGVSWHPQGMIVPTAGGAAMGLGTVGDTLRAHPVLAALGAFAAGFGLYRLMRR